MKILPSELEISLANFCPLNCSYCIFSHFKPKIKKVLDIETFKKGITKYIKASLKDKTKIERIGFVDAPDPLFHWELLKECIRFTRKILRNVKIEVQTNGLFLDNNKIQFLKDMNVTIVLRFDGPKIITDLQKRFKNSKSSVFNKVLANIKKIKPNFIENIDVAPTFTPPTYHLMGKAIKFFYDLGFRTVQIKNMGLCEIWQKHEIEGLKKGLGDFFNFLHSSYKRKKDFKLHFTSLFYEPHNTFNEFILQSNGKFYVCYWMDELPSANKLYVGDINKGIFLNKFIHIKKNIFNELTIINSGSFPIGYNPSLLYATISLYDNRKIVKKIIKSYIKISNIFIKDLSKINKK